MTWLDTIAERIRIVRTTHPCHCGRRCGHRVPRGTCGVIADDCPTWADSINQPELERSTT